MDLYEGVNALLEAIGEIPITDNTQATTADATSDVGLALSALLRMNKTIQLNGYWFNKEVAYPLVPNTEGYIAVGDSVLSLYSSDNIVKDHKLYSIADRSFIFETAQDCDIIFDIVFDDLPYVAADYITREATASFYNNILGDTQELGVLQQNAQKAGVALQKAQAKHRKVNLMTGSRLVDRTTNPIGLS
jgi:hypothetical protein